MDIKRLKNERQLWDVELVTRKGYKGPGKSLFPNYEMVLLQSKEKYPHRLPLMGSFKDWKINATYTRWLNSRV